jgi:hypothetical protein
VLLEGWHPDPSGRHELRWFDGHEWTWSVHSRGTTSIDSGGDSQPDRAQVTGGGTLFSETHIEISQEASAWETTERFTFANRAGLSLAHATEPRRHMLSKALRLDQGRAVSSTYSLASSRGLPLLQMHRPGARFSGEMTVADANGHPLGRILQEQIIGTAHLAICAGDTVMARVDGEAPLFNRRYAITKPGGDPIGEIVRCPRGVMRWDSYVLATESLQPQPLRALLIALVLFVDSAYHNSV